MKEVEPTLTTIRTLALSLTVACGGCALFATPSLSPVSDALLLPPPALTTSDRMELTKAERRSYGIPAGSTISWANSTTGAKGTISILHEGPLKTNEYTLVQPLWPSSNRSGNSKRCREFKILVTTGDGTSSAGTGIACPQTDGTWDVREE